MSGDKWLAECALGQVKDKWLLSVEETARLLGLSPRSIYNSLGKRAKKPFPIKPKRVGRLVKFDIRDVKAYIDSL